MCACTTLRVLWSLLFIGAAGLLLAHQVSLWLAPVPKPLRLDAAYPYMWLCAVCTSSPLPLPSPPQVVGSILNLRGPQDLARGLDPRSLKTIKTALRGLRVRGGWGFLRGGGVACMGGGGGARARFCRAGRSRGKRGVVRPGHAVVRQLLGGVG